MRGLILAGAALMGVALLFTLKFLGFVFDAVTWPLRAGYRLIQRLTAVDYPVPSEPGDFDLLYADLDRSPNLIAPRS